MVVAFPGYLHLFLFKIYDMILPDRKTITPLVFFEGTGRMFELIRTRADLSYIIYCPFLGFILKK